MVRELAARLQRDGVRVWLDEEQIKPGDSIPVHLWHLVKYYQSLRNSYRHRITFYSNELDARKLGPSSLVSN